MRRSALPLASVVALAYAACFVVITVGLAYAPPLRFAGGRALLAGATLLALSAVTGRGLIPPGRVRAWLPLLAGLLTLQYAAMFLSPAAAGAGISSVLANTGPILLVVLAVPILHTRITVLSAGALLVGAAGVGLIAWPAAAASGVGGGLAIALPLGVALGAAAETVVLKRMDVGEALLPVAAWQLLLGALPLLLASTVLEGPIAWSGAFLGALLFLALPGTALALGLWYWLVQREPITRLAGFMLLVPVAGLLLAWAALGEDISGVQGAGAALAVGGILLATGQAGDPVVGSAGAANGGAATTAQAG